MSKLLDWLEEDEWTRFASARDSAGKSVPIASIEAESWDLFAALYISFRRDQVEEFYDAVRKLKKAYSILFPEYYKANVDGTKEPTLVQLNDELTSFSEVRQLLSFI